MDPSGLAASSMTDPTFQEKLQELLNLPLELASTQQDERETSTHEQTTRSRAQSGSSIAMRRASQSTQMRIEMVDGKRVVRMKTPVRSMALQTRVRSSKTIPLASWPMGVVIAPNPPRHIEWYEPELPGFCPKAPEAYVSTVQENLIARRAGDRKQVYQRRMLASGMFVPGATVSYPRPHVYSSDEESAQDSDVDTYSDGEGYHQIASDQTQCLAPGDAPGISNDAVLSTTTSTNSATMGEPEPSPSLPLGQLMFESRFESGNLASAHRVRDTYEYDLLTSCDLYTTRHNQWFYFRVTNMTAGTKYRININNFLKPDSLYNHGMQPVLYSEKAAKTEGKGWHRQGTNVCYFQNRTPVPAKPGRFYYTLSFEVVFEHTNDVVYLAHCYPYTYTMLQRYLTKLLRDPQRSAVVRQRVLCRTLANNVCDLLTVTNFGVSQAEMAARKGVVITARVHPGESNASYMMKGFIDYITSDAEDAKVLRDHFVFKIIPMMNPDGVIVGNYRCSLAAADLNRTYKHTIRELFPTVYACKIMMQRLARDRPVLLYCDLHGHSRNQNVFIYGCNHKTIPKRLLKERIFPFMMSKNGPSHFSYKSSKFSVKRSKESTGRIVTWRELNLVNSFTMEATFCGSTIGRLKNKQFRPCDFEEMGPIFFDTLMDYCDPDQTKATLLLARFRYQMLALEEARKKGPGAVAIDPAVVAELPANQLDDNSGSDDGSDSSPSEGETEAAELRYHFGSAAIEEAGSLEQVRAKLDEARSRKGSVASLTSTTSTPGGKGQRKKKKRKSRRTSRVSVDEGDDEYATAEAGKEQNDKSRRSSLYKKGDTTNATDAKLKRSVSFSARAPRRANIVPPHMERRSRRRHPKVNSAASAKAQSATLKPSTQHFTFPDDTTESDFSTPSQQASPRLERAHASSSAQSSSASHTPQEPARRFDLRRHLAKDLLQTSEAQSKNARQDHQLCEEAWLRARAQHSQSSLDIPHPQQPGMQTQSSQPYPSTRVDTTPSTPFQGESVSSISSKASRPQQRLQQQPAEETAGQRKAKLAQIIFSPMAHSADPYKQERQVGGRMLAQSSLQREQQRPPGYTTFAMTTMKKLYQDRFARYPDNVDARTTSAERVQDELRHHALLSTSTPPPRQLKSHSPKRGQPRRDHAV
eukprot:m.37923 g.37923  ORF g.37923 m.37923 type:complete len:1151 (+) comp10143_c0_seq1:203-3655(+)